MIRPLKARPRHWDKRPSHRNYRPGNFSAAADKPGLCVHQSPPGASEAGG